jgi:hypothetical protein
MQRPHSRMTVPELYSLALEVLLFELKFFNSRLVLSFRKAKSGAIDKELDTSGAVPVIRSCTRQPFTTAGSNGRP